MKLRNSSVFKALLVIGSVIFFISCEKEFNTIGVDIVDDINFGLEKLTLDVLAYNHKLKSVSTNSLGAYQLGDFNDEIYGHYKASFVTQLTLSTYPALFGNYRQDVEELSDNGGSQDTINENERVTAVYLNIPYFSTALADTVDREENEPVSYRVDSIFGDRDAPFTLKVQEFTKFLRDLDPESGFQDAQQYFSDEDPSPFLSTVLYEGEQYINEEELLFFETEDDPDTEEDESETPSERLSPRLRIELDKDFFQEKILDMEGSQELSSSGFFLDYLRGIFVSIDVPTENINMLFDLFSNSDSELLPYIEIQYEYDAFSDNDTDDDTSDDGIVVEKSTFRINFNGNKVNYIQESEYPSEIAEKLNAETAADKIFLRGGAGTVATVDLSGGMDIDEAFGALMGKDVLINEANLIFYLDEEEIQKYGSPVSPERLYLYDIDNQTSLIDFNVDPVGNTTGASVKYPIFSGVLVDDDESDPYYKFRITEHVKRIINSDSTNVHLGLSLPLDISSVTNVKAYDAQGDEITVPRSSVMYPFGTILHGSAVSADNSDKRLRLEIYYTEPKN
ncbi:DUF4270 domain-containing protein [Robertkochia solimangrovi]|uniref:DUF4270 domain-containing protein n=1 Tax=Robertkochia solimangrovi TaxID=2213046 RepID=UPI00117D181F|nr:DUF4270 domain-containing protein [Robertkochia solimangrovi]TRZ45820.1 DUF4270 domain-containing protein [Robertkochia solimangrovi]